MKIVSVRLLIIALLKCLLPTLAGAQQPSWDLPQCISYAQRNHPLIRAAQISVSKNKQNMQAARAALLPSINTGMNHSYSFGSTIAPTTNQRADLNVQYDQFFANAEIQLLNWQQLYAIGYARLTKDNSLYELEAIKTQLSLDIVARFFAYINNRSWTGLLKSQITGMQEQVKRVEKEEAIGSRPKSDIYDSKSNLVTLQEQWITARNEEQLSKIRLLNAMGINRDSLNIDNDTNESTLNAEQLGEAYALQLVLINPAFKAMEVKEAQMRKSVKIAKAAYYPTLGASYSWSSFYTRNMNIPTPTPSFSKQWSENKNQQLSFALKIPIFNRFQVKTTVINAKLDIQQTGFEKQDLANSLMQSIQTIQIQYHTASDKYQLLRKNFINQKLSFQRSEEKYNEGLIDAYTFFLVRNSWLQANFNMISAENNLKMQTALMNFYIKPTLH